MRESPSKGWILYHRMSVSHHLRCKPLVWIYFLHCLEEAAFEDHNIFWNGKEFMLKRGSFITTIERDCVKNGITISSVRRARSILKACAMITVKSTRNGSLINVENYTKNQDWRSLLDQHLSSIKSQSEQNADTKNTRSAQQHKEIERNKKKYKEFKREKNLSFKEGVPKIIKTNLQQRGCSDKNQYEFLIQSTCSKKGEQFTKEEIREFWDLGIHYKQVQETYRKDDYA